MYHTSKKLLLLCLDQKKHFILNKAGDRKYANASNVTHANAVYITNSKKKAKQTDRQADRNTDLQTKEYSNLELMTTVILVTMLKER